MMAYTTTMIAVNWYGPFGSIQEASAESKSAGVAEGLYLAVNNRGQSYVGLSSNVPSRLSKYHHVLGDIRNKDASLWVGLATSQSVSGRGAGTYTHSLPLVIAERALAYFLETSENVMLRSSPPSDSFILINRWFSKHYPYSRRSKRGHQNWPDLIEYDREIEEAQLVWFGGGRKTLTEGEIQLLKRLPA